MTRIARRSIGAACAAFVAATAIAQSERLFVYPQKGQSQRQQDVDTAAYTVK